MMEKELISIVVPVYNVEKFLNKCIDSIINQSYDNLEIILVDDGSKDNSGELCDEYARTDKRIKVIHQTNGGLSAARNSGIESAQGSLIAFVDSDDYIHPDMIERLYQNMIKKQADISVCDFARVGEQEEVMQEEGKHTSVCKSGAEFCYELYRGLQVQAVVAWNKLYRIELLRKMRYPVGKLHEDEYVTYKLLYHSPKVVYTNCKMYYYVQRESSIMGEKVNIKHMDVMEAVRNQIEYWGQAGEIGLQLEAVKKYRRVFFIYYSQFIRNRIDNAELNHLFQAEYKKVSALLKEIPFIPYKIWIAFFMKYYKIYIYLQQYKK